MAGSPERRHGLTLPNAISLMRAGLALPAVALLVHGSAWALWVALIVMALAEASDALDGVVARRRGEVSRAGMVLDPMADSLYRLPVFAAFLANQWMPVWILLLMIWRDVGVAYLRIIAEQNGGTLASRPSGKWKAVAQAAAQLATVAAYAGWGAPLPEQIAFAVFALLAAATAVTAYSLADYAAAVVRTIARRS